MGPRSERERGDMMVVSSFSEFFLPLFFFPFYLNK